MTVINSSIVTPIGDISDIIPMDSFYYDGDIENLKKPWVQEPHYIPTVSVYSLAFFVGIIGNILVIFAMIMDRHARTVTSSFMVSLAIADILFLLVCVPYETSRYTVSDISMGSALCLLSGFIEMLSAVASILNLTAISIERYSEPHSEVLRSRPKGKLFVVDSGTSVKIGRLSQEIHTDKVVTSRDGLHTTEVSVFHNNDTSVTLVFCTDHGVEASGRLAFSVYQFLAMFVFPTTIMIFCYTRVIYVLWISSKDLMNMTSPESKSCHPLTESGYQNSNCSSDSPIASKQRNSIVTTKQSRDHSMEILKARKQVIKMLLTIIIIFLICWGPKVFFKLIGRADPSITFHPVAFNLKIVLDCLPYVQSCLNPIIYGFMSKNFRRSLRAACRSYVCRKEGVCESCCKNRQRMDDFEMESRTVNGTIATKMSMLQSSSS